jgi:hypothetical protein
LTSKGNDEKLTLWRTYPGVLELTVSFWTTSIAFSYVRMEFAALE